MIRGIFKLLGKPDLWLLIMRFAMGFLIFTLGFRLLTEGGWNAWVQIGGFLPKRVSGPFGDIFLSFWENQIILHLVIWSSMAIGVAMVLGLFVRLASFGGALLMLTFYISNVPPQFGWVNQQLIFFLIFSLFPALGPGYKIGLDYFLQPYEQKFPVLKFLTG